MLTQSVRRIQPVKRTSKNFAKPADFPDSESPLEQGGLGGGLTRPVSEAWRGC